METMTKSEEMAMAAVRETPARIRRASNTAHTGTLGQIQGRTMPFAGCIDRVIGDRVSAVANAPFTGVVYPHLKAPPV